MALVGQMIYQLKEFASISNIQPPDFCHVHFYNGPDQLFYSVMNSFFIFEEIRVCALLKVVAEMRVRLKFRRMHSLT